VTNTSLVHPAHRPNGDTRELRALELYRRRGHEIRHVGEDLYLVPSGTGRGFYSVDYREEACDCPDSLRRRENCKHRSEASPHACNDGFVYIGHLVEEVEVFEAVPCRRCAEEAR
jgi:hypothetical protein